jgi:CheY-like chemotaxis protein
MESSHARFRPSPVVDYGRYAEGGSFNPSKAPGRSRRGGDTEVGGGASDPDASLASSIETDSVRFLVVDDQPDVLATTVELFKLMGYEVLSASNGKEAVEILASNPDIQVLFSDVVMPGMNGFKLGHEARRLIPGINVILASGFQGEAMAASGADIGDFHFLVKPYRMADVARVLRK